MKKPDIKLPKLPQRESPTSGEGNYSVESAEEALRPIISAPPESSVILEEPPIPVTQEQAKSSRSRRQAKQEVEEPAKEIAQRYSTWLYPSQIKKLKEAADDYERRHPKRHSVGQAGLIRLAVDLIPGGGKELDEFIDKATN